MRIGIDGRPAKWYRGTGIGTYSYQLIQWLNNIDNMNDYLIFMPNNSELDIDFNTNFQIKNITENAKVNFWDEVNVPNLIKNTELNLYHVPQNGIGLPTKKNCPFVITLHDVIPYKLPETVGENYLKIFLEQMPAIIKMCDAIITVSNYSKQDIINTLNFPEEKIFVTHLASEDIYKPLNKKICKNYIKKKYGICEDFILYIGGFSPRKNIVGLIEAFSKLVSLTGKDISLIIAGKKGKSYSIYKKRAEDLNIDNKVIFPGFIPIDDLPCLYNAAELFVYPSLYEGFGLPPIEAMACSTPVITSNTTSIPEVVKDCAILVEPQNIDELYFKMQEALTDTSLRNCLITKGLIRASELTWENTAKETIKIYNQISKRV